MKIEKIYINIDRKELFNKNYGKGVAKQEINSNEAVDNDFCAPIVDTMIEFLVKSEQKSTYCIAPLKANGAIKNNSNTYYFNEFQQEGRTL